MYLRVEMLRKEGEIRLFPLFTEISHSFVVGVTHFIPNRKEGSDAHLVWFARRRRAPLRFIPLQSNYKSQNLIERLVG